MSAKIIDFPCEAAQLELKGFVLIAWCRDYEGGRLWGLWRPLPGQEGEGYQYGCPWPPIDGHDSPQIKHRWASRSEVVALWNENFREPWEWHYLCTKAEAFPEKKRRYVRPPRAARMLAHA